MENESFVPTAQGLVEYVKSCMKVPHIYLWDGNGQYVTTELVNELAAQYPDWYTPEKKAVRLTLADKGIRGWDCIGIIKGYVWNDYHQDNTALYSEENDYSTRTLIKAAKIQGPIEDMPEKPGLILWKPGHVGVYIGDGQVIDVACIIHATDITHHVGGIQQLPIEATAWTHWLEYPGIDYSEETKHD